MHYSENGMLRIVDYSNNAIEWETEQQKSEVKTEKEK